MVKSETISALKGIAILGVVLVHSPLLLNGVSPYIIQLVRPGQLGCQLLFIITAFLLRGSWERCRNASNSFKQCYALFLKKRMVSILPVYCVAVVFYQLFSLFVENFTSYSFFYNIVHKPLSIVLNFIGLNGLDFSYFNNVVPGGWFVGTLMLFYLFFPLLYGLYRFSYNKGQSYAIVLLLLSVVVSFCIQFIIARISGDWANSQRGSFLYYSLINQLPCFITGFLLRDIFPHVSDQSRKAIIFEFVAFSVFLTVSMAIFYILRNSDVAFVFFPLCISLALLFFILLFKRYEHYIPSFLHRIFVLFGDLSYGVYYSNFIGTMMLCWLFSLIVERLNLSLNINICYFLLLPLMFIISYYLARPIQKLSDFYKNFVK